MGIVADGLAPGLAVVFCGAANARCQQYGDKDMVPGGDLRLLVPGACFLAFLARVELAGRAWA